MSRLAYTGRATTERPGRCGRTSTSVPRHRAARTRAAVTDASDLTAAAESRIEGVAKRVAEEVEREHGGEDRDAGADAHPPLQIRQVALRVVDVLAPRRIRRARARAEGQ